MIYLETNITMRIRINIRMLRVINETGRNEGSKASNASKRDRAGVISFLNVMYN